MVTMSPRSDDSPRVNVALWEESLRRLEAPVPEYEQHRQQIYRTTDGRNVHIRYIDLSQLMLYEFNRLLNHTQIVDRSYGGLIKIHGVPFNYTGLIKSIYAYKPGSQDFSNPQWKTYHLVTRKLQEVANKVPLPKKSWADRVSNLFSCHDCGDDVEYLENQIFKNNEDLRFFP